jgi:hypothetical protein
MAVFPPPGERAPFVTATVGPTGPFLEGYEEKGLIVYGAGDLCGADRTRTGKLFILPGKNETCWSRNRCMGGYNLTVSMEFLDRLASQLKIGKDPACRHAIERILDAIKKNYENGQYQSPVEAERDFRQLVEREENGK